jgi:hypothetical protein
LHQKGLIQNKPDQLLQQGIRLISFYIHIGFGGIAMLTGWTQFSKKLRNRWLAQTLRFKKHISFSLVYYVDLTALFP